MTTSEYNGRLNGSLEWAVAQAVRAPSTHNAQPWRFRIRGSGIELLSDRSRALPVVDPEGRELATSCGAALFHLRLALRSRGLIFDVRRLPEVMNRDVIAHVSVAPGPPPTADELTLFEAIGRRHTSRAPYLGITVPDEVIAQLRRDVEAEGAWLAVLSEESQRVRLVAMVMEADHVQWSDRSFREELALWMRPNDSPARDGIFGYTLGLDNIESHLAAMAVRLLDRGSREAVLHRDLVASSPLLVVLGTEEDSPLQWIRVGEALDRALLRAESEDVRAAFLNQPIEAAELRPQVGELTGRPGTPQVILRLGYGPPGPGTPRRAVSEVLV